jgi:serine phosphatase RsbU (regulator of sigma subunit)/tetratricopeptide (TPR) repeat protein
MDSLLHQANNQSSVKQKLLLYNEAIAYSWYFGAYDRGIEIGLNAKKLAQKNHFDSICGLIDNNIGICYDYKGMYPEALNHFFQALRTAEKIHDYDTEGYVLSNIGLIYNNQGLQEKALEYHLKSLEIRKKHRLIKGVSASTNNLAIVYMDQKKYDKAIHYFNQAVKIDRQIKDSVGLADDFNNLGVCYEKKNALKNALYYHNLSLQIKEDKRLTLGIATSLSNIGIVYKKMGNLKLAHSYLQQAEKQANTLGSKELQRSIFDNLRLIYQVQKRYDLAYDYLVKLRDIEKEIENEETVRSQTQTELTYQFDKKQEEQRLLQVKKDLETKKTQENARIIIVAATIVACIIFVFSMILLKRWREAKAQKLLIEEKNKQVELKNNEILDSITYAKRIQTAILPSDELLMHELSSHFVFYEPKDIVAGDFYWFEEMNDRCFLAVADCTGHGVPGAMMSVVCNNALNRSVKEFNCIEPGEILDTTRKIIVDELSKNNHEVYDGMDISLISWKKSNHTITWAGANNPLWIWRGQNQVLEEWKADKQPIGKYTNEFPFTTHTIEITQHDRIFLFTDGYADQFGGPESKKFKTKNLKSLIRSTCSLNLNQQEQQLRETFYSWKGQIEQIDDVCIVGIQFN